jgi:type III secretion protein HrpB1
MIDSSLRSKEVVSGLIELLSTSINHNLIDEAETLLACVRGLRPGVLEFDTFEAWIATRRGHWTDAIRILRAVEFNSPDFALAKALLAFCQFALGDAAWERTANAVLENDPHPDAVALLQLLVNPMAGAAPPGPASRPPEPPDVDASQNPSYLRA